MPSRCCSVALTRHFFLDFFARERLIEEETRLEPDSAHQYVATCPEEYSEFVRKQAPKWVVDIHQSGDTRVAERIRDQLEAVPAPAARQQ